MPPTVIAIIATAVTCHLLIMFAGRVGWVDQREGLEYRKPREEAIPLIGGAAIVIGVLFASILGAHGASAAAFSLADLPWMALAGAFVLGLIDDVAPRGLGARSKFLGQCLVAALFALDPGTALSGTGPVETLGLAGLCLVAMNAVNTYDHADGFAGGVAAIGLLWGAPVLACAALGYLPFNTVFRQRVRRVDPGVSRRARAPRAMLGDSGSHMLGVALVAAPGGAWFLLIPILDLARVAIGRIRLGNPFWRGDRTHLGHRLEGLGFQPTTSAGISALAVAPPLAAVGLSTEPGLLAVTLLASATLYFSALVITDAAEEEAPGALVRDSTGEGHGHSAPPAPGSEEATIFPRRAGGHRPSRKGGGLDAPIMGCPPAGDEERRIIGSDPSGEGESAGPFAG